MRWHNEMSPGYSGATRCLSVYVGAVDATHQVIGIRERDATKTTAAAVAASTLLLDVFALRHGDAMARATRPLHYGDGEWGSAAHELKGW